ncbi:hypothetical protein GCM10010174_88400 [Kutzneria viridogrisea]|uniref:Centromere-binding protein ParB C-terminal domain-containing protein n=1 Tax=Kutzneria viridogrisea TaxID=47990 RepID=A0ABR6BZR4_9PSEU|nr:hypothetical protein [Kutzneria viridogrisea]
MSVAEQPDDQQTSTDAADTGAAAGSVAKRAGRSAKTTLTVDPDVLDDAKNGFWFALGLGRYTTFAEYVTAALAAHNEAIRATYNEGEPFPQRPTTNLPTTHMRS